MVINSPVKIWRNQKKVRELLGKEGEVLSWTVVRTPPKGFEAIGPYVVALINMGDAHVVGMVVDVQIHKITFGTKVRAVVRRVSHPQEDEVVPYGIKFVPL